MNIKEEVSSYVWEAIAIDYNNGDYSKAVEDAFFLLTKTLRSATGDTDDGTKLVRKALSGDNPAISLNNQVTQSEIDFQKGICELTIGMYTAIRNPLIHEKLEFSKDESDVYLCIISYLLDKFNFAHKTFDQEEILSQLTDPLYVATPKYSKSLVDQIAKYRFVEVLNLILENIDNIPFENLYSFFPIFLLSLLKKDEKIVYKNISKKLGKSTRFSDWRILITCLPSAKWDLLDESTRIRMEHIILKDIEKGQYDSTIKRCKKDGALGTWIELELLEKFENINEICDVIIRKLQSDEQESINYVIEYFLSKLFEIEEKLNHDSFITMIKREFAKDESEIIEHFQLHIEFDENHQWRTTFKNEIESSKVDFTPFDYDIL